MKKILIILICAFIFSGCTQKTTESDLNNDNVSTIQEDGKKKGGFSVLDEDEEELEVDINNGSAKAIENETDLWMQYENEEAEFLLRYPGNVDLNIKSVKDSLLLTIDVKEIDLLEGTMGYNKETALINKVILEKGEYGDDVDFPLIDSKKVRDVDSFYSQDFLVLSRFEVCSVELERKLYFFHNDNQVVITLYGPKEDLLDNMNEYFQVDSANCVEEKIWIFEKQGDFYKDLVNGTGSEKVQEWYDTFDQIVDTIIINDDSPGEVEVDNIELLQGRWKSVDDTKSEIEFDNNMKIDYYDGKVMVTSTYKLLEKPDNEIEGVENKFGKYLVTVSEDKNLEYIIDSLDEKKLDLIYLPRGNMLKYIR